MKYFLDFEFHEHFIKPNALISNRKVHTIEPIQIGIVDDDGNEFSAYFNDFDLSAAWKNKFLRENIFLNWYINSVHGDARNIIPFDYSWFKYFIKCNGKSRKQIQHELREYIFKYYNNKYNDGMSFSDVAVDYGTNIEPPEFYGAWSAYDWVAFCQLFGSMNDLPNCFPYYCFDVIQLRDSLMKSLYHHVKSDGTIIYDNQTISNIKNVNGLLAAIEATDNYPKGDDKHNALDDAKWTKSLYEYLQTV